MKMKYPKMKKVHSSLTKQKVKHSNSKSEPQRQQFEQRLAAAIRHHTRCSNKHLQQQQPHPWHCDLVQLTIIKWMHPVVTLVALLTKSPLLMLVKWPPRKKREKKKKKRTLLEQKKSKGRLVAKKK